MMDLLRTLVSQRRRDRQTGEQHDDQTQSDREDRRRLENEHAEHVTPFDR